MSYTSQGPGWWRASNGRWYPPEALPGKKSTPDRQPNALPDGVPAKRKDPHIQEPFILRKVEPLNLERDDKNKRFRWSWRVVGALALVILAGGIGTFVALGTG